MLPGIKNKKLKKVYQNKGKMHYGSKSYSNPFFDEKKKLRQSRKAFFSFKIKLISYLFLFFTIAVAWFVFYSSYFKIKNVNVSGGDKISHTEIEKIAWDQANTSFFVLIPKRNIFLFDKGKLEDQLREKYSFNELSIEKKIPSGINISYDEKKYAFVWKEDDKYYYAGIDGEIISEATEEEITGKNYPIVHNQSGNKLNGRQISVDHSYLDLALDLNSKLKNYPDEFTVANALIDNEINTVKIQLASGPTIYFNTERNADEQIEKLLIIKKEKIKEDFMTKTYIDLRVGNSVYYR